MNNTAKQPNMMWPAGLSILVLFGAAVPDDLTTGAAISIGTVIAIWVIWWIRGFAKNFKQVTTAFAVIPVSAIVLTLAVALYHFTTRQVVELVPPYPGATFIGELEAQTDNPSASWNTGNYTLVNDGKRGFDKIVMVLLLWNYGDTPNAMALKPGESWQVEKTIAQNWNGHLILWQLPPDSTPTPMPTNQLGDPCTLSFVTCPETPTP